MLKPDPCWLMLDLLDAFGAEDGVVGCCTPLSFVVSVIAEGGSGLANWFGRLYGALVGVPWREWGAIFEEMFAGYTVRWNMWKCRCVYV